MAWPRNGLTAGCRDGNFSTTASLASSAARSVNERRAGRGASAGRSDRGVLMVIRLHGLRLHGLPDPSPQLADLRGGLAVGRELGDAKAGAKRILMVDALHDIGQREPTGRMQRHRRLADAAAARRR